MRFTFALLGLPAALLRKRGAHGEAEDCEKWNEETAPGQEMSEELAKGCMEAKCDLFAMRVVAEGDAKYQIVCTEPSNRKRKQYHKKQHRMRH